MRNAAETFELDYSNLMGALGELDDAWRDWRSPVGAGISSIYSKSLSILFKINEIGLSKDLANEQFLSIISKIYLILYRRCQYRPENFQFYPRSTRGLSCLIQSAHSALSILSKINLNPMYAFILTIDTFNSIQDQHSRHVFDVRPWPGSNFQFYPRSTGLGGRRTTSKASLAFQFYPRSTTSYNRRLP